MMDQFVVWHLRGVKYLCYAADSSGFVQTIKRLDK